jgi:hypothetical protein
LKKRLLKFVLIGLIAVVLFAFAFNGYPTVTDEDRTYINRFLQEWKIPANKDSIHASFESEVAFISRVQDSVIKRVEHDPKFVYQNNQVGTVSLYHSIQKGSCYDRAILMEKIFTEYGFNFRHMYLFYSGDSTNTKLTDFFRIGLASHAIFEIKTKKGWMVVGVNGNWLGINKNNEPMTLNQVRDNLKIDRDSAHKKPTIGINFYETFVRPYDFKIIYGVYSRHGEFLHSPMENFLNHIGIPSFIPDYNLRMLLYNF